ncbi:hypothetical protein [Asaia sp. HN010]|uniref:hypothetical protein n=1 Tax=Asaia sp. HN010 TaxID=3081233 RepID=UPI0030168DA2
MTQIGVAIGVAIGLLMTVPIAARAEIGLDVTQFGARCDDKSDDTKSIQDAIDAATVKGVALSLSGICRVKTLRVPVTAKTFLMDGNNATLRFLDGGLVLSAPQPSTAVIPYVIRNLKLRSVNAYADTAISVRGAFKGLVENVNIDRFKNGVELIATSDNIVRGSFFDSFGDSNAVLISGTMSGSQTVSAYASNNTVTDVTDIHGTGVFIGPGVQGTKIRNLRVLEGWYGIYAVDGKDDEDLSVSDSYLEGKRAGLFADGVDLTRVVNCSADLPSSGADPGWAGFHMDRMYGGILANSSVWGAAAAHSPVIVAGGNINVIGNQVTGPAQGPCMKLIPFPKPDDSPLLVSNNTCWASGGYEVSGRGPIAGSHNLWSRPDDHHLMARDFPNP